MATYRKLHIKIDPSGGVLFGKKSPILVSISITPPLEKIKSDEQALREMVKDIPITGHSTDYFISVLNKICYECWLETVSCLNIGRTGGVEPWINFLVKDTDSR
jgi:hypothetical protein